jgi:hypothetical protein
MGKRAPVGGRASAARSLLVLTVVLLVAGVGATAALPRLRHAVGGLLFGDSVSGEPPIVCRRGNVLVGVYDPWRLAVRAACATIRSSDVSCSSCMSGMAIPISRSCPIVGPGTC